MNGPDEPSRTVRITRIYNNNVVLCEAADGTELVLVGKGLGHAARPGVTTDPDAVGVRRFVPDPGDRASSVAELLSAASLEETEVAHEIVEMAADALHVPASGRLLLPVLDHLSFARSGARDGIEIDYPLRWEVEQVFPAEAELGRRAVGLVEERLGTSLQDGEWSAFALHFVTYQWSEGSVSKTMSMAGSISQAFTLLETAWGLPMDQRSMSAARFVTHVRYLWARAIDDTQLTDLPIDIMSAVKGSHPQAAAAAEELAVLFSEAIGAQLTPPETAYLALHTSRLYVELTSRPPS